MHRSDGIGDAPTVIAALPPELAAKKDEVQRGKGGHEQAVYDVTLDAPDAFAIKKQAFTKQRQDGQAHRRLAAVEADEERADRVGQGMKGVATAADGGKQGVA